MQTQLINLARETLGEVDLRSDIFGIKDIRRDIIKLVVDWQLLKKMSGNHKTKSISEISGTTRKPFKQKGTGNARQGSLRSVQMRGGAVSHGPIVRKHAVKLPKKVRKLGLLHALSCKFQENKLLLFDSFKLESCKTSALVSILRNFGGISYFVVDNNFVDINFALASSNIHYVSSVPQIGINVYDLLRYDYVFLSKDALLSLEKRL